MQEEAMDHHLIHHGFNIIPVILSGGSGSRLWPLSRQSLPKQLLKLVTNLTMLQETALRVKHPGLFLDPMVICNEDHRFLVEDQLKEVGIKPSLVVLEPFGRNTAPAAAIASLVAKQIVSHQGNQEGVDFSTLLMILPADHFIADVKALRVAVESAATVANAGHLLTFGIKPSSPATGYGYISKKEKISPKYEIFSIDSFVEKPNQKLAEEYLASKRYLWNSGMFLFQADQFISELEKYEPEILQYCRSAIIGGKKENNCLRLDKTAFENCKNISIDHAIMEKTKLSAVMPVDLGWSDIGSWSSLWELGKKDDDGNHIIGDGITVGTRNSLIHSDRALTVLVGVEDIAVVSTGDAILVTHRDKAQNVSLAVEALKQDGREQVIHHQKVYRPWGYYQSIYMASNFQVKRLTIKPGASISLQKHYHRSEHWVVVEGIAQVTLNKDIFTLQKNDSIDIPVEAVHRLQNFSEIPLSVIEVQTGDYLGEDDIVRFEDNYGRVESNNPSQKVAEVEVV